MTLDTYRKKRDFARTAEPRGKVAATKSKRLRFVIQKHDASRLHYDLRLEVEGVLKSWAVPKGPSLDPAKKSLAVQVEDHPIAYGGFEGIIPAGEYGGGTVLLWDEGTWEPDGDPAEGLRAGKLHFSLDGSKLQGEWRLVQMHGRFGDGGKNWLLIKSDDAFADATRDIAAEAPLSVKTKRSMEQIAKTKARVWTPDGEVKDSQVSQSGHTVGKKKGSKARTAEDRNARKTHARELREEKPRLVVEHKGHGANGKRRTAARVTPPAGFSPQLAVLVDHPPTSDEWLHEIKFDGYRIMVFIEKGRVRLVTRNGNDWTSKFPTIAKSFEGLQTDDAVLDGEIVVLDARGASDFQALQAMLKDGEKVSPSMYLFDLPFCDGEDLRQTALIDRKNRLEKLLKRSRLDDSIRYSAHLVGDADDIVQKACGMKLEGIISKRRDSFYVSRREASWVKSKCDSRQEFVIVGYTEPQGSRSGFGALLLGYQDAKEQLVYAGRVGTGFDEKMLGSLHERLQKLSQRDPSTDVLPPARERRGAHWVKPVLVCEVRFSNWTRDGLLRHPAFIALRSDKPASQTKREVPVKSEEIEAGEPAATKAIAGQSKNRRVERGQGNSQKLARARTSKKESEDAPVNVEGVRLTHPHKVLYPDAKVTKLQLAEYYQVVAKQMLPHVANRPLALVRCPDGQAGTCFFQRNHTDSLPEKVTGVDVSETGEKETHVTVTDLAGVLSLVQIGVLEIHLWNCRNKDIEHPDQLVFDLDPGPDVAWKQVVEVAHLLKRTLDGLKLPTFVKTSGGKGLHITVPIKPNIDWDTDKAFCKAIVESLEKTSDLVVSNMRKDLRGGKVYIDYNRNGRAATAVAPYSTRARAGAAISMPVTWDEVKKLKSADAFTVQNAAKYLEKRRVDPWAGFEKVRVDVRKAIASAGSGK